MRGAQSGILAMVAGCTIWGLSPVYYRMLAHVPPLEVLSHRALWSLILFAGVLALQGRLGEMGAALRSRRQSGAIIWGAALISVNWFLFIYGTQVGRTTETSLGYFMFPLIAVAIGRVMFAERLNRLQWASVALCAGAVLVLTVGLGMLPWISLSVAITFGLYGALKKRLALGPVVSVTCEVMVFLPLALLFLAQTHLAGQGVFGTSWRDSGLLILSGPMTAVPMILFSMAARRVELGTMGVLQYINPSLQFFCAVVLFSEPFTTWHAVAFPMIWLALTLYTVALWRQDRASPAVSAAAGNPVREGAAKP